MRLNILAFALGVLLLQWQPGLPSWQPWALAGAFLIGVAGWLRKSKHVVRWLAVLGCCILGFAWAAWRAEIRLADELAADWEGRDVELVGVVASLPQPFDRGSRFEFDVKFNFPAPGGIPKRVMLSWYQLQQDEAFSPAQTVHPGETWRFTVRLKRPHGNANPGGFDYEAWLLERSIRATGYIRPGRAERLDDASWHPAYLIEAWRDAIRSRFNRILPEERYPWSGVLTALAIGDQKAISGEMWTTFNRTGTTHLMSISGLHVTMLAALAGWVFSFFWRRSPLALYWPAQKVAIVSGCGAAFGYALLAGFGVPAQRTLYMLMVSAIALLSGRMVAPSRILMLALLVVVVLDPWAVLAAGFWLSFGAVGALLWLGSAQGESEFAWQARVGMWIRVQWAATLASIPILLLVFQQLSLVSPLANAVAIPVISFVVTPLVLLAIILPLWPLLALAHAVLDALMMGLDFVAAWPVWQAPTPPLWVALGAACGVAVALLPKGVPGRHLGLMLVFPALIWPAARPATGTAEITVLDVGQGLASIVETAGHTLVYDPGPLYSSESDAGQRVVVPYLRHRGINRLDMLIVTHRDSDHAGGTASVRAAVEVDEIRSSVAGLPGQPCVAGQHWEWDGVRFSMLYPVEAFGGHATKSNHSSCVLMVEAAGKRMLLTSDIEAPDEASLIERGAEQLRADVLLVPHHGSRTSSTPGFLAAVDARDVVIPVGYRNRFGHPKPEVVARYVERGSPIWRTDRDGAVSILLGQGRPAISAWRSAHPRYWHGR